jgi:hypothetical protein
VTQYNKQALIGLADELVATAKQIAEAARQSPEDSPLIDKKCENLGKVLSELKTVIR